MYYCCIKRSGNILKVIRMIYLTSTDITAVMSYAIRRDAQVYDAHESLWDNAIAFDLCPCVEYNGKRFITIHEPD